MGFCCACFGAGNQQRKEEERLASEEARSKAAEAAQKRQEQYEKSAAGRAARAQQAAAAKQSASSNKVADGMRLAFFLVQLNSLLVHEKDSTVISGSQSLLFRKQTVEISVADASEIKMEGTDAADPSIISYSFGKFD